MSTFPTDQQALPSYLNFSKPQFPYLQSGNSNRSLFHWVLGRYKVISEGSAGPVTGTDQAFIFVGGDCYYYCCCYSKPGKMASALEPPRRPYFPNLHLLETRPSMQNISKPIPSPYQGQIRPPIVLHTIPSQCSMGFIKGEKW